MARIDTIEYSVCEDCHLFIAYGGEDQDDVLTLPITAGIEREVGDKQAHFVNGIAPTEDDEHGAGYDEFSHAECELCRSHLAGSRHGATLIIQLDSPEDPA